jgi:hypothetical protein
MMIADESTKAASAATSTVGTFFGQAGVVDTAAVEMMRASGATAPMLSRAEASRYFAR